MIINNFIKMYVGKKNNHTAVSNVDREIPTQPSDQRIMSANLDSGSIRLPSGFSVCIGDR